MPAAQPAVVVQPTEPKLDRELLMSRDTIILAMDHDETSLAEMWVQRTLGEDKLSEFLNLLDLRSLRKPNVVIALVRGKGLKRGRTPALGYYKAEGGERVTEAADADKLVDEMVVCKPVFAKDHWEDGTSARYGGKLRLEQFVSALGEAITPACVKFVDAASRSKGEFPSEMVLRWS